MTLRQRIAARSATIPPAAPPAPMPMRGLGDLVAKMADPIGKIIGLDKSKCGCAKRQDALNRLLPFTQRQDS